MDRGELIVLVDSREAVPVRAIPYVTGWEISPDVIAKNFARAEVAPWKRFEDMHAHHLHSGPAIKIRPKEWSAIVAAIAGFQSQAHAEAVDDDAGYAIWRTQSASFLPAGVFVWRDEFEADWVRSWSRIIMLDEKDGDRELLYSPMMSADVRSMVLEGFQNADGAQSQRAGAAAPPVVATSESPTRVNKLRRNNLDPAIDQAVRNVGTSALAEVYLELKEMALTGTKPFTGVVDGAALCYTNDKNETAKLTKDALGKRLKSRGQ